MAGRRKNWLESVLTGKGWQEQGPSGGNSAGGPDGGSPFEMMKPAVLGFILLILAWGGFSSFYTVQPEERAVVKRFGQVIGITDPGLNFKIPFGIDQVQRVATERVLKQEFGFRTDQRQRASDGRTRYTGQGQPDESLMLTGDLNVIDVEWVVQYRIADPIKYLPCALVGFFFRPAIHHEQPFRDVLQRGLVGEQGIVLENERGSPAHGENVRAAGAVHVHGQITHGHGAFGGLFQKVDAAQQGGFSGP